MGTKDGEGKTPEFRELLRLRLKYMTLTLLAIKPSHGYELSRMIEGITLGRVKAGPGSLYPVLKELLDEKLVEEETIIESGKLRKVYRLTEKGWTTLSTTIEVTRMMTTNLTGLLDTAWEMLKKKRSQTCIPPELLEHLRRLERTVHAFAENIEERICKNEEK